MSDSRLLQTSRRGAFGRALAACCALLLFASQAAVEAQTLSHDREMGRTMLGVIKSDIKKNYYDPSFRGIDLDAHFKAAEGQIKQAASVNEVLSIIAQTVMGFKDSHTYFLPPLRPTRVEHGWQIQMIGDTCYVVAVQPGSDAEAKGLKPGDRIIGVEGFKVSRAELPKLQYVFHLLSPRTGMALVVQKPDGKQQQISVQGKVYEGKVLIDLQTGMASERSQLIRESQTIARLYRHRYYEIGDDVFIWKMPQFDLSERQIDELMSKAKKRKAMVLDLRGNGGGAESVLLRLLGHFFDRNVKVGDLKRRSETRPLVAKTRGANPFAGKLFVLVDSDSASAAEVFARVVQNEKLGIVIGDRTAGLVMRGKSYDHQFGQNLLIYYGVVVTDADLVTADGKSLERVGVVPDELMLPGADDLAAGRDPVLAHAARLAGLGISPEKAGALFPVEWRK